MRIAPSRLLEVLILSLIICSDVPAAVPFDPPIDPAPVGGPRAVAAAPIAIARTQSSMMTLWSSPLSDSGVGFPSIYVRATSLDGTPLNPAQHYLGEGISPAIAANDDGYIVVWLNDGLRAARFDVRGIPTGEPFQVRQQEGYRVQVVPLPSGWRVAAGEGRFGRGPGPPTGPITVMDLTEEGDSLQEPVTVASGFFSRLVQIGDRTLIVWLQPDPGGYTAGMTVLATGLDPISIYIDDFSGVLAPSVEVEAASGSAGLLIGQRFYRFDPLSTSIDGPVSLADACRDPREMVLTWRGDRYIVFCSTLQPTDDGDRPRTTIFGLSESGDILDSPSFLHDTTVADAIGTGDSIWALASAGFHSPVSLLEISGGTVVAETVISTTADSTGAPAAERWRNGDWFVIWATDVVRAALVDHRGVRDLSAPLGSNVVGPVALAARADSIVAAWTERATDEAPDLVVAAFDRRDGDLEPVNVLRTTVPPRARVREVETKGSFTAVRLQLDDIPRLDQVILFYGAAGPLLDLRHPVEEIALSESRLLLTRQTIDGLVADSYSLDGFAFERSILVIPSIANPRDVRVVSDGEHFLFAWINNGDHLRTAVLDEDLQFTGGEGGGNTVTTGGEELKFGLSIQPAEEGWIMSWMSTAAGCRSSPTTTFTIRVGPTGHLTTPLPHLPRYLFRSCGSFVVAPSGTAVFGSVQDFSQPYGGAHRPRIMLAPSMRQRPIRR